MNVMVVDDQTIFRQGLVKMLQSQSDMDVVGEAGTVADAVVLARNLKPDLILLDYSLPDGTGPDAARSILSESPKTNIIFLTIHDVDNYLLAAIRTGAMGYLLKDIPFEKLMASIRALGRSEPALSPKMTLSLMRELAHPRPSDETHPEIKSNFTPREVEILRDLTVEASNQEIAEDLFVSIATVKNDMHQLFRKLNLNNRKEIARYARRHGFIKM